MRQITNDNMSKLSESVVSVKSRRPKSSHSVKGWTDGNAKCNKVSGGHYLQRTCMLNKEGSFVQRFDIGSSMQTDYNLLKDKIESLKRKYN